MNLNVFASILVVISVRVRVLKLSNFELDTDPSTKL